MAEWNASTPESESSTAADWVESAGHTVEGLTKALLYTKGMGYLVSCLAPAGIHINLEITFAKCFNNTCSYIIQHLKDGSQ